MAKKKFEPTANPLLAAAMRGLRASNAAQPHEDRRERRARTRQAKKLAALRDQQ